MDLPAERLNPSTASRVAHRGLAFSDLATRSPSYVSRHREYKYKVYKVALTKDRWVVGRSSH
jgi:hypothetical protein